MATSAGGSARAGEDAVGVRAAVDVVGGSGGAFADAAGGCGKLHVVPLVAAEICGSSNPIAGECSLFPTAGPSRQNSRPYAKS
jgi:hypothetical protein